MNIKTALIIGGSGGIGAAITKLLAKKGFKVYSTYHSRAPESGAEGQNADRGADITPAQHITHAQCDIRNENQTAELIQKITAKGTIDIIINCATSRLKLKPFEQISSSEFKDDVDTILLGAANIYRAAVPVMKKQKSGIIINLISAAEAMPPPRMSSYISAKAGLLGLTKSLAAELKNFNIKVIGISPSFVDTGLLSAFPQKLLELERENLPSGEFIQPDDIAELLLAIIENPDHYGSGINILLETRKSVLDEIRKYC